MTTEQAIRLVKDILAQAFRDGCPLPVLNSLRDTVRNLQLILKEEEDAQHDESNGP